MMTESVAMEVGDPEREVGERGSEGEGEESSVMHWWWANDFVSGSEDAPSFSPELHTYFLRLISTNIETIRQEPHRLRREKESIVRKRHELAVESHSVFLNSAACVDEVKKRFDGMGDSLSCVIDGIPNLLKSVSQFRSRAAGLQNDWEQYSNTCDLSVQLLEVMEVPLIMETCIRNGLYGEALDVMGWAERLRKRFPKNRLVAAVHKDVESCARELVDVLLSSMSSDVDLATVLHVLSHLRRMGTFSEEEIHLIYLRCRDSFLQEQLDRIPRDFGPHEYCSRFIEQFRLVFDIICQYQALFGSSTLKEGEGTPLPTSSEHLETVLLFWATERIESLLWNLENAVGQLRDVASMSSLLEQASFLGTRLSRVGVDFRPLLAPIFEKGLEGWISRTMSEAVQTFKSTFSSGFERRLREPSRHTRITSVLGKSDDPSGPPSAPLSLLEFHELAIFANAVVASFNDLRSCAPLTIKVQCANLVSRALMSIIDEVVRWKESRSSLSAAEATTLDSLISMFDVDLLSYVSQCFDLLFQSSAPLLSLDALHTRCQTARPPLASPSPSPVTSPGASPLVSSSSARTARPLSPPPSLTSSRGDPLELSIPGEK